MKIELIKDEAVYRRPYRMSQGDREKTREIVQDLEENGIIRESTSPYANPAIRVSKKNGDARMPIDYRDLNKLTKRINYPLPVIDDQIDQLMNKNTYTYVTFDFKSGFYQIPMHSDSMKFAVFIISDGQWTFLQMSFHLTNVPALFQRVMIKILRGHALVYIDDILIAAATVEEAFQKLEVVLKIL